MERVAALPNSSLAGRVLGAATAAVGALLAGGGLWLVVLGGSPYYLVTGIGYLFAGTLLWRRRSVGAWLMAALLGITICWALLEVSFDYWALFPLVVLSAGLALLALAKAQHR
jgi:quinoprotein glucose dehydrogenase